MFDLRNVLLVGMNHTVQKLVTEADTASQYGRGSLGHLIATPAFVALIIDASIANVEGRLPQGFVTVGTSFNFMHDAPTCMGMTLRVKSTIKVINGESILFDIVASDEYGAVGHGQHQRIVVNREHLFEKATQRLHNK